jgi:hypothetical protein
MDRHSLEQWFFASMKVTVLGPFQLMVWLMILILSPIFLVFDLLASKSFSDLWYLTKHHWEWSTFEEWRK